MEETNDDVRCKRCGACCYLKDKDNRPTGKKCRYLVIIGNKSSCRIYGRRIGVKISDEEETGRRNICGFRKDDDNNYLGCPFNN